MSEAHPPRPRLTLNIGITGHRASVLSPDLVAQTSPIIRRIFDQLRDVTEQLHDDHPELFAASTPQLRLHTPLATGADQMAATVAQEAGFRIRALLPFAADEYSADFKRGRERREFVQQLELAHEVFALPSDRADAEAAYVQVGKAVVAASDILIAVWDGGNGNGPGGTAHVVDLALTNGVPVIHVPIDRAQGVAGEPLLIFGRDIIDYQRTPICSAEAIVTLLTEVLLPEPAARAQAELYLSEEARTTNLRMEYPLLLWLLRVKGLPRVPWRQPSIEEEIASDWREVREPGAAGMREALSQSYAWANFLAIRYAQLFRSGHITNYVLSALAVNLALFGLIVPSIKILLVVAELGVIGLLFLNTNAGTRGDWHRKWLQYRYLAETLRPFLYLKRTGMVGPPFRTEGVARNRRQERGGSDWTRWYAAAVWRQMDWPVGELTEEGIRLLAGDVVREQLLPQAAYHRVNSERMHKLDHRLHEIGNFLIGAVIAACFLYIGGYFLVHEWTTRLTGPFIFLTAGLPAIGAAVFGMRGHGEHLLAASRSAHSAEALAANAERLGQVADLEQLAHELENSASIMLADLNEWTATYSERSLEIPA
ncbi:hypothetical protein GCM10022280_15890 [Sphingomonas swuensis]|uniref:SMODS and SLOG-associating 2TM effector domain-containing protein n=1 Tax=Sphingomonas swuensis TaxID=977800 RepID=A0ABP7SXF8_9SPHN